jgi:HEAT repeat protein
MFSKKRGARRPRGMTSGGTATASGGTGTAPSRAWTACLLLVLAWMTSGATAPAIKTVADGRSADRKAARIKLNELAAQLGEPRHERRRAAVRELAELGTEPAWELLLGALADPRAEVADEAQWQLGFLEHPGLSKELFGSDGLGSRDPWVRLRVAEALGRMPLDIDANDLLPAGTRGDLNVSRTLLWSLERRARCDRLGEPPLGLARKVEKLVRGNADAALRADALATLAALDADAARSYVERFADDRHARCRVAALVMGVDLLEPDAALDLARALADDEADSVRAAAVIALEDLGVREGLDLLVQRLEKEPRMRTRQRALDALQRLSGMRHRADPRPWRAWIAGLPPDWRPARAELGPTTGGTVAFAGLPLLSDRLAFLIDFSGSLWVEREGREPRKTAVDAALSAALPKLDPSARFLLVPYTAEPHPWRDTLEPAKPRLVERALQDFKDCRERGSGNAYSAIELALAQPDIDTIVLLTDGAPTGGRRWKMDLIVELLAFELRFRPVAIDLVLVDAPGGLARRWKRIAANSGGRAVEVSM